MEEVRRALQEMRDSLKCPICLEMMKSPSSPPCGHTFCHECIVHAVTSAKRPKCPLCQKKICRRSINNCCKLELIVEKVKDLETAVYKDAGITVESDSPVYPTRQLPLVTSGTPGIQLHSYLHPTPLKPHPQNS